MRKSYFSDLEILEKNQQMNTESMLPHPNTIIDTPNTEKQEHSYRNEQQNKKENRNTTHRNHIQQRLTPEEKMNIDIWKRIMPEKNIR